jgi:hypothetical protein
VFPDNDGRRLNNLKAFIWGWVLEYRLHIHGILRPPRIHHHLPLIIESKGTDIKSFLAADAGGYKDIPRLIPPNKEEHKCAYGMCKNIQLQQGDGELLRKAKGALNAKITSLPTSESFCEPIGLALVFDVFARDIWNEMRP